MKSLTEKTTKTEGDKVCFSHIRFSTKVQAEGTSLYRHLEIAPPVAKEKGWIFDATLNAQDLGLSAFKQFNPRDGGGLRSVIEGRRQGKFPAVQ
jgi:hypothetical protein